MSFNTPIYASSLSTLIRVGKEATYPTDESIMSFRYTGGPEDYENVSLCDVLDGTVPAEAFDGSIVLIGAYAAGMMDAYFVPVDKSAQMYGVEIHANAIQAMMEDKTLEVVPVWVDALMAAVMIISVKLPEYMNIFASAAGLLIIKMTITVEALLPRKESDE